VTTNIAYHPIGANINELYYTASSFSLDRGNAYEIVTDDVGAALIGGADRVAKGKLFAVAGPGDFDTSRIEQYDHKQYIDNIFQWLLRPVMPNDVGLWNFQAPDVRMPSQSFYVNATVTNYGSSDQVNVDVYLFINGGFTDLFSLGSVPTGASKNVSFTYSHPIEETILVELQALPQPGPEDYPEDNLLGKNTLITSMTVVGWTFGDSADFASGLEDVMNKMTINYDPSESGFGETGPQPAYWSYPFIIFDGAGNVISKKTIQDSVFNESVVVVNYNTFEQILDDLNQPNVFTNDSYGFSSRYIFVGGGLIVESDFSNDDYLADEWRLFSQSKKGDLALHLSSFVNILLRSNDLTLAYYTGKEYMITGLLSYINATIYNAGSSTHNNMVVNLSIDSVVVDTYTILTLGSSLWETVSFSWTPPSDGIYDIEIRAEVQAGEQYSQNNYQSITSTAYTPTQYVLVDIGHGTKTNLHEFLIDDQRSRNFWINSTETLNTNMLSKHGAVVILNPGAVYSVAEINALKTFLNNGGGLFVIGGSNDTVLSDLTAYANITWNGIALPTSEYSNNFVSHETTMGIDRVYYTQAPFSIKTNGISGPVAFDTTNSTIISAYSVYGPGKVFTVSGELDFTDDYFFFDENLNYSRNIMDWLLSPLETHDVSITNFEISPLLKLDEQIYLNATLGNIGLSTESGVIVNLIVNGSISDSKTIPSIAPGNSALISFLWTPQNEGNYTIEIEVLGVPGEIILYNNFLERFTSAKDFLGLVLVDQTHTSDPISTYDSFFAYLAEEGIGFETHDSGPITPDVLSGYGAFLVLQPDGEYSISERQAIENFVTNGGGLMVIGDDVDTTLTGLTEFAQMNWISGGSGGKTTDITHHPVTVGVDSYHLGAPIAEVVLNGSDVVSLIRDSAGGHMLAVCTVPGRVASWVDENAIDDSSIDNDDNKRCAINTMKWVLGVSTPHDLAVSSLQSVGVISPDDTAYVNSTVWNFGTNDETDVYINFTIEGVVNDTLYIPFFQNGTSMEVSFTFTTDEENLYNLSIAADVVAGETATNNNYANKTIRCRFIEGSVLFEQGHGTRNISYFSEIVNDIESLGFTVKTNSNPINASILSGFSVFVIPNPQDDFSADELTAIRNFVANGGGLWVIGDERQEDVLASLTGFAGINWTDAADDGECQEIIPHEVTQGVTKVVIDYSVAQIIIDSPDAMAVVNLEVGALTMCAVSEPTGYNGRVAGFADEDTMDDKSINLEHNLLLAENIIIWLAAPSVINSIPEALDVQPHENEEYRTNSTLIFANGYDEDDTENNLVPHFEYRNSSGDWETSYLSSPEYISSVWQITFTPPIEAELGLYDFRVKFEDLAGAMSNYTYANNSHMVKNNAPWVDDIQAGYNSVIRTQSIYIYANGSDLEDTEDLMMPEFEHKNQTGSWDGSYFTGIPSYDGDTWFSAFVPTIEAQLGVYDFRVRFMDFDGNYSVWFEINNIVEVFNNPPDVVDITSAQPTVYRGETVIIYVNGTDLEDPEDQLQPSLLYETPSGIWSPFYLAPPVYDLGANAWRIDFAPDINAEVGNYNFSVYVSDSDSGVSTTYEEYSVVTVMNNEPSVLDMEVPAEVKRGENIKIFANGEDLETSESTLTPLFTYKAPQSAEWKDDLFSGLYHLDNQWEVVFTPSTTSSLGSYQIRLIFEDKDDGLSAEITGTIEVKNNPPSASNLEASAPTLYKSETITISAKGSDMEDDPTDLFVIFENKLSTESTWQTSYLSNPTFDDDYHKMEFTPSSSAALGIYDFRVQFRDSEGDFSSWKYKNGSVELLSNAPTVLDITLDFTEVLRGETVYIFANAADVEDTEGQLSPHFEYLNPDTGQWEDSYFEDPSMSGNQWRVAFTPPASAETGFYNVKVRFSDRDLEFSDWVEADSTIEVKNNLPSVEITTEGEQDKLEITFSATVSDIEDTSFEYKWEFGDGGTSTEKSPSYEFSESGTYTIYLEVTDPDSGETIDEAVITIEVAGTDEEGGLNMMMLMGILIPIIIAVLLLVLLLTKKKKEEEVPPATVPQAPGTEAAAPVVTTQASAPAASTQPAAATQMHNIKCPQCKNGFQVEAQPGQTVQVTCPNCGISGQMKF
jgi:PKD repeat protein